MNENKKDSIQRWFQKAENDLINIENNLRAENSPADTICFHAQQAIEKYIKGALIYFDRNISKTHDLVRLLTEISLFIPELSPLEEELDRITDFAVQARYPDAFYEPSLDEAKEAYEVALKVKSIILQKVTM